MEKPKQINDCPFCDSNKVDLLFDKYWYYKCSKCNEEFTTTESDTISIETQTLARHLKKCIEALELIGAETGQQMPFTVTDAKTALKEYELRNIKGRTTTAAEGGG